ncbi:four helix bundle protein [Tissierella creatinini]|nr:four helix bundle protein [Tissierella creatinini]TJX61080.1 four helix bundle protein [Soehngenia saccharolytica]
MEKSILASKSIDFAIRIINLCKELQKEKKEYILSNQLLRSGTSIGANIREAKFAQSIADFISKMSIALTLSSSLLTLNCVTSLFQIFDLK